MKMGSGLSAWARRDDKMSRDRLTITSTQRRIQKHIANAKRRRRDKRGNDT